MYSFIVLNVKLAFREVEDLQSVLFLNEELYQET